jgi:hypothetical protein
MLCQRRVRQLRGLLILRRLPASGQPVRDDPRDSNRSQVASIFSPRRMVARRSEDHRRQRQPEEPRRQNLQHSRDDAQACQHEGDPGEHCPESSAQGHPLRDIGNHQKSKGFSWGQSRSAPLIRETQDRPSPYEGGAPGASSGHQQKSARLRTPPLHNPAEGKNYAQKRCAFRVGPSWWPLRRFSRSSREGCRVLRRRSMSPSGSAVNDRAISML